MNQVANKKTYPAKDYEKDVKFKITDALKTSLGDWANAQENQIRAASQKVNEALGADDPLLKTAGMISYAYSGAGKLFDTTKAIKNFAIPITVAGMAVDLYRSNNQKQTKIFKNEMRKTTHMILNDIIDELVDAKNQFIGTPLGRKIIDQLYQVYTANNREFKDLTIAETHTIRVLTDDDYPNVLIQIKGNKLYDSTYAGMKSIFTRAVNVMRGTKYAPGKNTLKFDVGNCFPDKDCVYEIIAFERYTNATKVQKILNNMSQYDVTFYDNILAHDQSYVTRAKKDTNIKDMLASFQSNGLQTSLEDIKAREKKIWTATYGRAA